MPIKSGSEVRDYFFEFEVTSVNPIEWDRYRRPRRPMPPPTAPVRMKQENGDHLVTAIVIAGLVGVSALLLTQKKSAPSE